MVTGDSVEWFSKMGDSVKYVMKMQRPRYVKSHLPFDLLPQQIHQKKPKVLKRFTIYNTIVNDRDMLYKEAKIYDKYIRNKLRRYCELFQIIYVARNPKDTCVSFYHYCRKFHNIVGSFEEFADLFLDDNSMYRIYICVYICLYICYYKNLSVIIIYYY